MVIIMLYHTIIIDNISCHTYISDHYCPNVEERIQRNISKIEVLEKKCYFSI